MTKSTSLCQISGGLRNTSSNMTQLHWKIILRCYNQERSRNAKSSNISLNAEGIQRPLNQRSDPIEAKQNTKDCTTNIQQSLEMETNQSLLHNKSGNGLINNLKASKSATTDLNLVQDGNSILLPRRRIHLRLHTGNKAATGSQIEDGIRGKHHLRLNSNIFFFVQRCHYACWKFNFLAIDGECRQTHLPRTHSLMHSCCTDVFHSLSECTVTH